MANEEIRQKVAEELKVLEAIKQKSAQAEAIWADVKRLNNEAEHIGKSLDVIRRKALGG